MVVAWVLALACAPGRVGAAPPQAGEVHEEPPPEPVTAVDWYGRGMQLAAATEYQDAAAAFLRSYELQPTPEALFNAAFAYESAGRPVEAIATYRQHLDEPGADPDQRTQAQTSIETLLREVAVVKGLRIDPNRPPVELTIAGEAHALDAFPLVRMPGEVLVEVVDADGVRGEETYLLAAGDSLELDVRAVWPEPAIVPVPPEPEPKPDGPDPNLLRRASALRVATWTGIGLTGGGLIAIGVAGGLTASYHRREASRICPPAPETCDSDGPVDRPELIERALDAELATNIAIGVTAVLAVTTLAIGLSALRATRRAESGTRPKSAKTPRVRVRVDGLAIEF